MSDLPEAVGSMVEGSSIARAMEPRHGEVGADGHTHESACLNCGTALMGPHCHGCGQHSHVHRTLGAFFHDLLHGVLHFEGKVWRTLPLLIARPGRLAREYIDGRRASYVSPIALFLFTVFLSFAVFSAMGGADALAENVDVKSSVELNQALSTTRAELARLERQAADPDIDADERPALEREIATMRSQAEGLNRLLTATGEVGSEFRAEVGGERAADLASRLRAAWNRAQANPQLLIYKLQSNAYKFSWLLIPLSVPFVWLTFAWRRRFGLYDHTVFTTYSITFMIGLLIAASLISSYVSGPLGLALVLYAPVHMYKQLRGTYALSRFSAAWRLVALSAFAWVAIILFAAALFLLSEG